MQQVNVIIQQRYLRIVRQCHKSILLSPVVLNASCGGVLNSVGYGRFWFWHAYSDSAVQDPPSEFRANMRESTLVATVLV